ncbi:MAG: DNA polymerase I [Legionellales bacterium]|nr:DNA polymerase I [Legionellales bacterium]
MTNNTLVLVDGSYYLFRAYHAMPPLTNSSGEPTGVIFGVINMIKKHLTEGGPDYFAVIFDAKGKTFRNNLYEEYKANRPEMAEELAVQIQPLHELIQALGIPLLVIDGVEADDVIATLAIKAAGKNIKTIISTGDKDLAQIVNKNIHLINTMSNLKLDPSGVKDKFGVPPERIIDYLTLVGDSVDNIPGVPKVGPKTAAKWLNEFGNLERIVKNADKIKGKVGENLRDFLPKIPLTKELVTLKCDVELAVSPEDLVITEANNDLLGKIYAKWNFTSWLAQLNQEDSKEKNKKSKIKKSSDSSKPKYEIIYKASELDYWLDKLKNAELISIDTETTSLDYMIAKIVGISFAVAPNHAAYIPLEHNYIGAPKQLSLKETLKKLKPILEDENISKVGQNLKYDKEVFANYKINLKGIKNDTMLASYVLNSTATRHNLDALARNYLNIETVHYEDVAGKGVNQITFNQVPIEEAAPYAAEDADIAIKLYENLISKLKKIPTLEKVYTSIEIPLLPVLSHIERNGVVINTKMLAEQTIDLKKRMLEIQTQAYSIANEEFNISSPKQIQSVLYDEDKMNLPVLSKTPKGQPSTAESVLLELSEEYELPRLILEYRSVSKLCSTYTEKLPKIINKDTGRVHTSYHQAVTATGRLSSSNPNLQNIPVKTHEGRKIRQAFIAPANYLIVAADYSQIELRIMAHLSKDQGLLNSFEQGHDIHKNTAAEVFDEHIDKVTKEQRRAAKAINFGLIYGMSSFGLAKQLGIERSRAQKYVDLYFDRYPDVKNFMQNTREEAKQNGFVETVYGRRLYLPEIISKNATRRKYAERTAINAPMQGTAADIIKLAMIDIDKWLNETKYDAKMIMQVHDELVFEVHSDKLNEFIPEIQERMTKNNPLITPLEIDIGFGNNWDQAH